ncbi:hypothetical protein RI367_007118 [Sorochytrium milnesiophthora]
MHTSTLLVALALLSFAAAAAAAHTSHGQKRARTVGAVYFIDNNPDGNHVIASSILSDGSLKFSGAHSTGGKGGSGAANNATGGPDALFSQGAVAIAGDLLFAVNPGSSSLTMFGIDRQRPGRLTRLATANTGGQFPVSVAVSDKRKMACVLNGGGQTSMRCFSVQGRQHMLRVADRQLGVQQSSVPSGPANTLSHVVFDQTAQHVLVSVKGIPPSTKGFVASFPIDRNGRLARDPVKMQPQGGLLPFGMALIPGGSSVLVTDPGVGAVVFDMKTGQSAPTAIAGQKATCWAARSPRTQSFYVTDIASQTMVEMSATDTNATVLATTALTNGTAPIDLAVASSTSLLPNDFLYINGAGSQTLQRFSLRSQGQAQQLDAFDAAAEAKKRGVTLTKAMQGMAVFMMSR